MAVLMPTTRIDWGLHLFLTVHSGISCIVPMDVTQAGRPSTPAQSLSQRVTFE